MAKRDEIAVVGGGGIGGCVTAALVRAGHRPTLCVRTPFDRLEVVENGTASTVDVPLVTDPAGVAPARWILLTTKAQDVADAAPWIRALAAEGSTVAVIQNGVDHDRRVAPYMPEGASVLPTIVYCAAERTAPGRVIHHGEARMRVPAGREGAAFAELFAGSDFAVTQESDFVTVAWSKLLGNIVANPITALTLRRMTVFDDDAIEALGHGLMAEAIAVAKREGAQLAPEDGARIIAHFRSMGSAGTSMLYDRLARRPLEHDYLTGAIVDLADRHGIAVPLNRAVLALLRAASGRPVDGSA